MINCIFSFLLLILTPDRADVLPDLLKDCMDLKNSYEISSCLSELSDRKNKKCKDKFNDYLIDINLLKEKNNTRIR